jgi:DNA-binding NarL/FixJ family response regulator
MRVLVTEDDPVLADVLIEFLRYQGHEVTYAADLDETDRLVSHESWDACILDPTGNSFLDLEPSDSSTLRTWTARPLRARQRITSRSCAELGAGLRGRIV